MKIEVVKIFKIELNDMELDALRNAIHFGVKTGSMMLEERKIAEKFEFELNEIAVPF